MFIVNFHKGKAYPFVQAPVNGYTDHVVDGEIVFGKHIHTLREIMHGELSLEQKFLCAESFFTTPAGSHLEVNPCIDFAVTQILHAPGQQTIAAISDKVGYSHKHFIHLFKTHVGMTPKSFMRVIRFQKVS